MWFLVSVSPDWASELVLVVQGASSIGSVLPSLTGEAVSGPSQHSSSGEAKLNTGPASAAATAPAPRNGASPAPSGIVSTSTASTATGIKPKPVTAANGKTTANNVLASGKVAAQAPVQAATGKDSGGNANAGKKAAKAEGEKEKEDSLQEYASQGESIQPQKPLASIFSAAGGSTLADTSALPTLAELQGGPRALGSRPSGGTSTEGRAADGMQEAARRAVDGVPPSRSSPPPGRKPPLSPGRMGPLSQVREADIDTGNAYMALHGVIHDTMSSGMLSGMLSGPMSYGESAGPTPRESEGGAAAPLPGAPARPVSPPVMRPASPQQQHTAPLWPTAAYTGEESVLSIDGGDEDPGGDADAESMAMEPRSVGSLAAGGTGMPPSSLSGYSGMPDPSAMSVDTGHLDAGANHAAYGVHCGHVHVHA